MKQREFAQNGQLGVMRQGIFGVILRKHTEFDADKLV